MKYMLLIYANQETIANMGEEERANHMMSYFAFNEAASQKTTILGGEGLVGPDAATMLRVRDGKTLTTDGPFAETKEQLGGYYLIDAANLDEALEIAAMIPDAKYGAIEVRPVMVYDGGLDSEG